MAERARMINWKAAGLPFNQQALLRLAIWGGAAAGALLVAVLTAHSNAGSQRPAIATAAAGSEGSAPFPTASIMARLAAHSEELESETRRLAEAVVALTADRDRLITRIASLERSLEDVTGSTKRQPAPPLPSGPTAASPTAASPSAAGAAAASPPAASPPAARPTAASPPAAPLPSAMAALMAPVPLASRDQITPNMDAPAPPQSAPAAADPAAASAAAPAAARRNANTIAAAPEAEMVPGRIDVGVDVGGASSFDGLRGLWNATRAVDAALFDGLRPLVVARESKSRSADLRLVVGPLANVDAATRLCVALSTERRYCQPTAFEGQELALAVPEPERRPITSSQRKPAPTTTNQRPPTRPKS